MAGAVTTSFGSGGAGVGVGATAAALGRGGGLVLDAPLAAAHDTPRTEKTTPQAAFMVGSVASQVREVKGDAATHCLTLRGNGPTRVVGRWRGVNRIGSKRHLRS